jgi:hypothetical protein
MRGILALLLSWLVVSAAAADERRVVFVMLDGLRWQEVFRGAETALADNKDFMGSDWAEDARKRFVDVPDRRAALMPFLTEVVAKQGALIGNRDAGSCAHVTNPMWFSYPGYNEALTGKADPKIDSNDYAPNPNVTVLEWLNKRPGFEKRVAAYGSWDKFPDIINAQRSGVPVNAGYMPSGVPELALVDELQRNAASFWPNVRLDAFTLAYAREGLKRLQPRMTFISFGETDDFAHMGDYAQYLIAANRSDRFLKTIWDDLQADPAFAGKTTMLVTVDHGRGTETPDGWKHHYSPTAVKGDLAKNPLYQDGVDGSDQTWIAAIGPGVAAGSGAAYSAENCAGLNQIAATALTALGEDWQLFAPDIGAPLEISR